VQGLLIVALLLMVAVTVFAVQNPQPVVLTFLFWSRGTSLALATIVAAVVGGLVVYVVSLLAQRDVRRRLRAAEARLRELERHEVERERPAGVAPVDETQRLPRS
jgi:uncharacterized integral membrane protein